MILSTFSWRAGTQDEEVYNEVVKQNAYHLPDSFDPVDSVIDVGAHVGCFLYQCFERGIGIGVGYEPIQENFNHLVVNLTHCENATLIMAAIWRSDDLRTTIPLSGYEVQWGRLETAVSSAFLPPVAEVPVVPLDRAIWQTMNATNHPVRLLKIDAEMSEWPILYTSNLLAFVTEIVGEYHEVGGEFDRFAWSELPDHVKVPGKTRYVISELVEHLDHQGFDVEIEPCSVRPDMGKFFAKKRFKTR